MYLACLSMSYIYALVLRPVVTLSAGPIGPGKYWQQWSPSNGQSIWQQLHGTISARAKSKQPWRHSCLHLEFKGYPQRATEPRWRTTMEARPPERAHSRVMALEAASYHLSSESHRHKTPTQQSHGDRAAQSCRGGPTWSSGGPISLQCVWKERL